MNVLAEGVNNMKQGIHPKYNRAQVTCTTCGNKFETGSVLEEIKVDTCNECHPFYTGRQRFASAAGRVERFKQKYNKEEK